jgi:ketosteroid isomerase-like protein
METDDREAIRDLLARYNHAIDGRQLDTWVSLFTDDAIFEAQGQVFKGAKELRTFADNWEIVGRHVTANELIEVNGNEATVQAYVFLLTGSPPIVMGMGSYVDEVRRVDGRWCFAKRIFTPGS